MHSVVVRAEVFTQGHQELAHLRDINSFALVLGKRVTPRDGRRATRATTPHLLGLDVDSGSAPFTVKRLPRLVQQLRVGDEIIEEEEPLALSAQRGRGSVNH